MPGGSRVQIGNEIFSQVLFLTVTPPAAITTAVVTYQNVAVPGLQVGDVVSYNLLQTANTLVSVPSMYVSATNVLTIGWGTEGATINSLAAQQFLIEITRPENAALGLSALPQALV